MTCEWQKKIWLYMDDELEPAEQRAMTGHLQGCSDCSAVLLEQQELKKAVRLAAKRFSAPAELYADVRTQLHPGGSVSSWWKWVFVAGCVVLFAALGMTWYSRTLHEDSAVAQLVDQHVTMLASLHTVDVESRDTHTVKPWYQGKLPFTFSLPNLAAESPYTLLGGKLVYAQHSPGAELIYQVRQHKISVFIFQARDVHGDPSPASHAFTVRGWQQGGLQYFVVTDAAKEDAERMRALFEAANRG